MNREEHTPQDTNGSIVSFFGRCPVPVKIGYTLLAGGMVGYILLHILQTDQMYHFTGRLQHWPWWQWTMFGFLLPIALMWWPKRFKTLSTTKKVTFVILFWFFTMILVFMAFFLVVFSKLPTWHG